MYHIYIETMSSYVRCLVSTGNHRIEIHTPNVMIHNGGKLKSPSTLSKASQLVNKAKEREKS